MSRTIHCCQSVGGPLANWSVSDWMQATNYMKQPNGEDFESWTDLKQVFINAEAEGKRVLPMCDCPDFDYQRGCPGVSEFDTKTEYALKFKGRFYAFKFDSHGGDWHRDISKAALWDDADRAMVYAKNNHITHHPKTWQRGPGQWSGDCPDPVVVPVLVTRL